VQHLPSCIDGCRPAFPSRRRRNTKKLVDDEISLPAISTVTHAVQLPPAELEQAAAGAEECRRALRWAVADACESMEERQQFHIKLGLPTQVCTCARVCVCESVRKSAL
jgi:hypothetical protein